MGKVLEKLDAVLREFEKNCDVDGSAIVTDKGRMICASLPRGTNEKAVAAMAAAMLSIGFRVGNELSSGIPQTILIDGSTKSIILRLIGRTVLVGLIPITAEISLINFELNKTIEQILLII